MKVKSKMLYIYLQKENIQSTENSTAKNKDRHVHLAMRFKLCNNYMSKPRLSSSYDGQKQDNSFEEL